MPTRWLLFCLVASTSWGACAFEPSLGNDCPCNPDGTCDHPGCSCIGGRVCVPREQGAICCLPRCKTDGDCEDDNPCTLTACKQGFCMIQPRPDGAVCGRTCDGLELTERTCLDGRCTGTGTRDCDDGDICTMDACDPASGCRNPPKTGLPPEGSETAADCGDGLDNDCDGATDEDDPDCRECTQDDECDDGNPCSVDRCIGDRCEQPAAPDGTPCGNKSCVGLGWYQQTCQAAVCSGSSLIEDCDDLDPCSQDECDPASGCSHTVFAKDEDADGHVDAACTGGDDCDDERPAVHPGAEESAAAGTCNDLADNDCDDLVDLQDPGCAEGMPAIAWFLPFGGSGHDTGTAVACDSSSAVYLTGFFSGDLDVAGYDGQAVVTNGSEDVLLMSFQPNSALRWLRHFGGPGSDVGHDLAVDGDLVCVAGAFEQTISFPSDNLTAYDATGPDGFIVHYDTFGVYGWSFGQGLDSYDAAYGVCTGGGAIHVVGGFEGSTATTTDPASSLGGLDGFLMARHLWGGEDWYVLAGSPGDDELTACARSPVGEVVVAGYYHDELTVDGADVLDPAAGSDALLGMIDPGGIPVFWNALSGPGEDVAYGVDVAEDGTIFVTGSFEGEAIYPGAVLEGMGGESAFLLALEPDGTLRWPKVIGGAGNARGLEVAAVSESDGAVMVFVTGYFTERADAGGGPLVAAGGTDVFVAAFDGVTGGHQWSLRLGAEGEDAGLGVAIDKMGAVVITGHFEQTIQIGDDPHTAAGLRDGFVMRLAPP